MSGSVLQVGQRFAERYRVLGFLGQGAMGAVYAALDEQLEERVALKVLTLNRVGPAAVERFRREVRLARKVSTVHVARTHDIGVHDGVWFLTMQLIEGESLRAYIDRRGALPVAEAVTLGRHLCEGLARAHEAGVVHRDLKPTNVLVDAAGRAVITDFGIARSLASDDATLTRGVVGTPRYMSPEQGRGTRVDARADLYALGLILVEMLAGRRIDPEVLAAPMLLGEAAAKQIAELGAPAPLALLVRRLLQVNRDERPAAAEDVAKVLAAVGTGESSTRLELAALPEMPLLGVLPFRGSGSEDAASLADVLAEELVDLLSRTRGLKVLSSRATAHLGGRSDAVAGAAALGAGYLVDGTLWRRGDQLRVSVRLIATDSAEQLYGERFDAVVTDVFEVQDRVARRIAEALRMELTLARRRREAPAEAVQQYLLARVQLRDVRQCKAAAAGLERAVELAPGFEPFVTMHAIACVRAWFYEMQTEGDAARESAARESVARALETAPDHAETHLAAGVLAAQHGRYAEAARALSTALEIAPTFAPAHEYLGNLECEAGRSERGIRRLELALTLDPTITLGATALARELFLVGREQESAAVLDDLELRAPPNYFPLCSLRLRLALWGGDLERLRSFWRQFPPQERPGYLMLDQYVRIALGDEHRDFPDLVATLETLNNARVRTFAWQLFAESFCAAGRSTEALHCIELATAAALADLSWFDGCPALAPVRDGPVWPALRDRVLARVDAIWAAANRLPL